MNTATNQSFTPLEQVTRPTVPTDAAAYYLNRRSQTLRAWACLENGPIRIWTPPVLQAFYYFWIRVRLCTRIFGL